MILKAISEAHPHLYLLGVMGPKLYSLLARKIVQDPRSVFDNSLWRALYDPQNWKGPKENDYKSRLVSFARVQWLEQIKYICGLRAPSNVYVETAHEDLRDFFKVCPVEGIASFVGHEVVYLDRRGDRCVGIPSTSEEWQEQQQRRESLWVDRIYSHHQEKPRESSVLIAGGAHVNGWFGLPEKLKAKGIELEVLKEFLWVMKAAG